MGGGGRIGVLLQASQEDWDVASSQPGKTECWVASRSERLGKVQTVGSRNEREGGPGTWGLGGKLVQGQFAGCKGCTRHSSRKGRLGNRICRVPPAGRSVLPPTPTIVGFNSDRIVINTPTPSI